MHVDRIYRLAYRMTGDDEMARECTQETFIKAFAKLSSFRGQARLSTWLHSVAVSIILTWIKKVKRLHGREADLEIAEAHGVPEQRRDPLLERAIARAIDALSAAYRTVVVMHDIEGYTHEEIGRALGISEGTSKVRLSRARKELRVALADFAGELTS